MHSAQQFEPKVVAPFSYTHKNGKYKFVLTTRLEVSINRDLGEADFFDNRGTMRMSFLKNSVVVHPGYAWDGASPKIKLL